MEYNDRLISLREEKKVSQKEVAEFLKIGRSTYACYETGIREPSIQRIKQLAEYFDCTTDYLLGVTDDKKTASGLSIAVEGDINNLKLGDILKVVELMKKQKK